jgi:phosphoribosylformimino-5-aminoimidazole carboxamide ribotide isomerase
VRVIPVIDLKQGQVVRAVAGQRSQYQAIRSQIVDRAEPASVAQALVRGYGFREIYVADLDAIAGQPPDWPSYAAIAATGLSLWVDAGLSDAERAAAFRARAASLPLDGIVVGLESVIEPRRLESMAEVLQGTAIFSLDLQDGRALNGSTAWSRYRPQEIAELAVLAGFRRLIILDLADVGVGGGTRTLPLCRQVCAAHPQVEVIAGGGVRGRADLKRLAAAGCTAALVASALHDGKLKELSISGGLTAN